MLYGALLVGPAQATAPPAVTGPAGGATVLEEVDQAFDEESEGPSNCLGGQQKRSLARLNDQPVSGLQEELTFTKLPGSRVVFNTNDTDQIMVTFSAEAQLHGQSDPMVAPVDFLQVRLVLDMMPMPPHNDPMFNTDGGGAHAIEACKRVPAGRPGNGRRPHRHARRLHRAHRDQRLTRSTAAGVAVDQAPRPRQPGPGASIPWCRTGMARDWSAKTPWTRFRVEEKPVVPHVNMPAKR